MFFLVGTVSCMAYIGYLLYMHQADPRSVSATFENTTATPVKNLVGSGTQVVGLGPSTTIDGLPSYEAVLDTGEIAKFGGTREEFFLY